jgi:hypothetical protein
MASLLGFIIVKGQWSLSAKDLSPPLEIRILPTFAVDGEKPQYQNSFFH